MVLAPNVQLCKQVVAAADSLKGPDGQPLVFARHIAPISPPSPRDPIDIAVVTPSALLT